MKKTYICPQTDVVMALAEQVIMAGSIVGDSVFDESAEGDKDVLSLDDFNLW